MRHMGCPSRHGLSLRERYARHEMAVVGPMMLGAMRGPDHGCPRTTILGCALVSHSPVQSRAT
jgi:hypothetical protein